MNQKTESVEKEKEQKKAAPNQWAKDKFREKFKQPKRNPTKTLTLDDISS